MRYTLPASLLVALALPLLTTAAEPGPAPDDWVQFRGPNRDGISPDLGLLKEWPKDGPPVVWKATDLGAGFSSVSLAGPRIFTMGDLGDSSYVFAVDRNTGKKLWSTPVGRPGGNYKGTRCTPTVDGDRVYAIGQFGDLVCLNVETGKEIRRKNFIKDFDADKAAGSWNYTESPLVDGKKLVCTPGGKVATIVALDKMTGDTIWKSPINSKAGYASMVISEAAGRRQYVQLLANGVVGVDADKGTVLWRYNKFAGNTANIPNPIVLGEQLFCTAGYGKGGALLTLSPGSEGSIDAREVYYKGELGNRHGGVVRIGDYIYGDRDNKGQPWCAEWKTGAVKWSDTERKAGKGSIAIVYADGHLYCRYDNGIMALVPASSAGYKETSTFKIPNSTNQSWNHPVVIGGRLYLREKDVLWCYDVKAK